MTGTQNRQIRSAYLNIMQPPEIKNEQTPLVTSINPETPKPMDIEIYNDHHFLDREGVVSTIIESGKCFIFLNLF